MCSLFENKMDFVRSLNLVAADAVCIACPRSEYAWTGLFGCHMERRACSFCNLLCIVLAGGEDLLPTALSEHKYFLNHNHCPAALLFLQLSEGLHGPEIESNQYVLSIGGESQDAAWVQQCLLI